VIAATASEALHILDGLLYHQSDVTVRRHHTDDGGDSDHVFALLALLGFQFAPRGADLLPNRTTNSTAGMLKYRSFVDDLSNGSYRPVPVRKGCTIEWAFLGDDAIRRDRRTSSTLGTPRLVGLRQHLSGRRAGSFAHVRRAAVLLLLDRDIGNR
jgi:Tn3 transposase DDE domain